MATSYSPLPAITIEYIGACLSITSYVSTLFVIALNVLRLTRSFNQTHLKALIVATLISLSILTGVIHIFSNVAFLTIYTMGNILSSLGPLSYILFQVSVFDRFRAFTSIHERWTTVLYITTLVIFVAFQTPVLLGYDGTFSDPNSVFRAWVLYSSCYFIYIGVLDVILSSYLLRLFLHSDIMKSNVSPEQAKRQQRTKFTLWFFLIASFLIDIAGVFTLTSANKIVSDETGYRTSRGFNLISGSVLGFHACMGLSYLTMLASLRASPKQSKTPLQKTPTVQSVSTY